ncbi:tripartite tricarboxylate transporter TctB family protein [Oribacterium sp. HCP28S3_H8]|uniref:tripartite tricarboxylate transporter TctB family protein n=1 Tax=Oribacterium sp. HCP28S3_H8 TaxID=3438945 RepID=UPI003F888DBD
MNQQKQSVKITTRIFIPICMFLIGIVFSVLGFKQYGFWDHEPKPGFFPAIFGIVLMVSSVLAFMQVIHETEKVEYHLCELEVIIGAAMLIIGSMIIGMIPMIFIYLFGWLKIMEKTPLKTCIIIMAIVGAIVIGVFVMWLQVQFPWGLLENIIG